MKGSCKREEASGATLGRMGFRASRKQREKISTPALVLARATQPDSPELQENGDYPVGSTGWEEE